MTDPTNNPDLPPVVLEGDIIHPNTPVHADTGTLNRENVRRVLGVVSAAMAGSFGGNLFDPFGINTARSSLAPYPMYDRSMYRRPSRQLIDPKSTEDEQRKAARKRQSKARNAQKGRRK